MSDPNEGTLTTDAARAPRSHSSFARLPLMLFGVLRKAASSPALRTAVVLGGGGLGFALGNLWLARILPEQEFGAVSLVLSLIQVGAAVASLGLPVLIVRHRFHRSARLLRYSGFIALAAAVGFILWGALFYQLTWTLAFVLGGAVALSGMGRVAGAFFSSQQRFVQAQLLIQVHNWVVLASAIAVTAFQQRTALAVSLIVVASYLVVTFIGWRFAPRVQTPEDQTLTPKMFLTEGLSAAGVSLALNVFFQLDRLVIARVMSLRDLAVFSVVAAIAGSAFRILQLAAGHTIGPRLRAAVDRGSALRMIGREAAMVFGLAALATPALIVFTPWIVERFLSGRYTDVGPLVIALVVIGFVRIWEGFGAAVVSALGTPRELLQLSVLSWIAIGASIVAAVLTADRGLVWVMYALGAGWLLMALGATALAWAPLARIPRQTPAR